MDNPIRLHWLDPNDPMQRFPPLHTALRDPNGLLAIGGDLSQQRLLRAYGQGIFPWFNPQEPILWWSPNPRTVLRSEALHVSRRLRRRIDRRDYAITFNRAPETVLRACAAPRAPHHGTWLGPQMQRAYLGLFRSGHLKTVEVWRDGELAGGIYCVVLGRMVFGESMFSRHSDGSKLAMYWLCHFMQQEAMPLLDCQVGSPHLYRLGAEEMSRDDFLRAVATLSAGEGSLWTPPAEAPCPPQHLPENDTAARPGAQRAP